MDAAQLLLLLILVFAVVQSVMVEGFNLNFVTLEPSPKPPFLANATSEAIKQFMAILRLPGIARARKVGVYLIICFQYTVHNRQELRSTQVEEICGEEKTNGKVISG